MPRPKNWHALLAARRLRQDLAADRARTNAMRPLYRFCAIAREHGVEQGLAEESRALAALVPGLPPFPAATFDPTRFARAELLAGTKMPLGYRQLRRLRDKARVSFEVGRGAVEDRVACARDGFLCETAKRRLEDFAGNGGAYRVMFQEDTASGRIAMLDLYDRLALVDAINARAVRVLVDCYPFHWRLLPGEMRVTVELTWRGAVLMHPRVGADGFAVPAQMRSGAIETRVIPLASADIVEQQRGRIALPKPRLRRLHLEPLGRPPAPVPPESDVIEYFEMKSVAVAPGRFAWRLVQQ